MGLSEAPPSAEIPREAWTALAVTTLIFFLVVIDVSAVNVAFPSIRSDFDVSEQLLGWIISGYNITVGALLLVAGRYADSLGRKRLFLPGVAVFAIGSTLCGLAPNVETLIAARVLQGVGGAVVSATSLAVVLPAFPPNRRSTVIGIAGATGALGAVAGPVLGAFLTDWWSWRGIFLINVPIAALVLAIGPRLLSESKNPAATGKVDLVGVPIGAVGVGLVMFGIIQVETRGFTDPATIAMFVIGLALIAALIRRSANHDEPLIELDLFAHRSFSATNIGIALYSMAFTSGFLVNSLLLQELWDQPLRTTGLALFPAPLFAAVVSPLAGQYADRIGHRWILAVGATLCASGSFIFLATLDDTPDVGLFVPVSLLVGAGVGMTIATWSSAGLADISPAKFGTSNSLLRTTQQVFYALGISVIIAIVAGRGGVTDLANYRIAWVFVGGCYLASAIAIATLFPSGSSDDRAALADA